MADKKWETIADANRQDDWLKSAYRKVEFMDDLEFTNFIKRLESYRGDEIFMSSIHKFIRQCEIKRNKK